MTTEMQVSPHVRTQEIEKFCPTLRWNSKRAYPETGNGLVYPSIGDEPIQEFADRPFFWISSDRHKVAGNLWDWIVKDDEGRFYIVPASHHAYRKE